MVDRAPAPPGLNVTVNAQDALVASEPPAAEQEPAPVFMMEKSPVFPPVTEGLMLVAVVALLFVKVNVMAALEEPTFIEPKFSDAGVRTTAVLATSSGCGYV